MKNKNYKHEARANPWSKANPLSLLLFTWIWPIFHKGTKKDLEPNDLYPTPDIYESEGLSEKFSAEWQKEEKETHAKGKEPKLYRVLLRLCKRNLILYFTILGFDELVIRIVQPITLRLLVKSFGAKSDISRQDQIIYGIAVCACTFFHNFVMEHCVFLMLRTGLTCRVACSSILYQKVMKLSPFARKNVTTGKVMNLMTNDLGRFDLGFIFLAYTVLAPIQSLLFIYFLWMEIGTGTLGGAAMILLIMPLQVLNGTWTAKFRENIAKQTDERSRIMNETILAIKVIKMMAWENPFAQLVNRIRRTEVKALGKKMYLKGFYLAMYTVCIKLTPFLSILLYVLIGNRITADKAFFTVAVFQIIIENMVYYFSIAIASLGEIWVSIQRIQEVLLMEEHTEMASIHSSSFHSGNDQTEAYSPKISLVNACASWTDDDYSALSNFNLDVEGDKLVMIIGGVGSGKSSLLHALVAELPLLSGECKVTGSITYAAQEPWLFAGTVKDNILFGKEYDKKLYNDVVRVSALEDDFKQLPNGEMTIVGERGMSLSGGQKARINLARALYRDADIVLLDDPLSAVDSRVSRHIFDKCVRKYLRGRLRILATHQLQYLYFADHVVVLKNGSILAQGSPSEIQSLGLDLISLIESNEHEDAGRRISNARRISQEMAHKEIETEDLEDEEAEILNEGTVGLKTYWGYLRSGDSIFGLTAVFLLYGLGQIIITITDFWLSIWTNAEEIAQVENSETHHLEKPLDILNPDYYYGDRLYMAVYGILILCVIVTALTRAVTCFRYFLQISVNLHNRMFNSLIRAPAKFFDDNPSGRIMNRFTKDIGSIDELLPGDLYDSVEYILYCCGVVVVVILSNYFLAVPSFFIILIVLLIRFVFLKTSRDLKRIEAQARSPLLSHLAASIQGMTTIRALKTQDDAIRKFNKLQDVHTAPWFLFLAAIRCFTTWIGTASAVFLTAIMVTFLIITEDVAGGLIGFVITSTISLTTNLQWALREAAEAENYMTCVARALEYTVIEPEAAWESTPDKKPPVEWPTTGSIKFDNVSLAYGDVDVLKNLSFEIKSKEKIGIVGRTGAGKSTILAALFRITEPRGDIFIDGINVTEIGLHDVRTKISIIPQDPVLFSGSIRYNLDPFNQYEDADVWKVLEDVQLKNGISALDAPVEDGGANFSIGQRQLICLARAILRKNKIIVMDEATANVDPQTDAFIQATIRDKFRECSIITIAHRLQSVMDCDKILLLEKGCMKEYDHPHLLLQKENGYLSQLVSFVGENASQQLKEIARKHYHDSMTD